MNTILMALWEMGIISGDQISTAIDLVNSIASWFGIVPVWG